MGVSNGDEDGGGFDGDGSRGNSPTWQGAGTETSVPRSWSSMAVALRNFSWIEADSSRVFMLEAIYRRKGDARGGATLWCGSLSALLRLPFGLCVRDRKIGTSGFVSSNSENISFGKYLE
jgi:hypothetical protein